MSAVPTMTEEAEAPVVLLLVVVAISGAKVAEEDQDLKEVKNGEKFRAEIDSP